MKEVTLVKLGGGLITDKTKPFSAKVATIHKVAKTIAKAHTKYPNLVLATGAGSFGHYPVVKYGIENGVRTKEEVYGLAITEWGVTRLNNLVVEALIKEGVPALGIHPSSIAVSSDGGVEEFFIKPLSSFINLGIIPVLHGDIVPDSKRGSYIMSTEEIFMELVDRFPAEGYRVKRIVHASLEKGVLDSTGVVIKEISTMPEGVNQTSGYDVTGGMKLKLETSLELAKRKIPTYIVDGRNEEELIKAIGGGSAGTKIG